MPSLPGARIFLPPEPFPELPSELPRESSGRLSLPARYVRRSRPGPSPGTCAGVTVWHINADEPSVLDYNTEFKTQDLYAPTPYRSSDHDPVVVGLPGGVQRLFLPLIER